MSSENLAGYLGKAVQFGREVITRIVAPKPCVIHESTTANEVWQGTDDNELAEVLIIAGGENTDVIHFSLYQAVGLTNYLPLYAKDSVRLGGVKYSDIHLKFLDAGCKIHIFRVEADGPIAGVDTV
jgi:hypothetical protein